LAISHRPINLHIPQKQQAIARMQHIPKVELNCIKHVDTRITKSIMNAEYRQLCVCQRNSMVKDQKKNKKLGSSFLKVNMDSRMLAPETPGNQYLLKNENMNNRFHNVAIIFINSN
jgi:hypothetical protein